MRFAFSDQQLEFRLAVRQLLDKECNPADLRAAFAHPTPRGARWATLADMGVVGLTTPEDHGGLGLSVLDLVLLLEEAGRAALPEPLAETAALAAPLLASAGGVAAGRWLDGIAGGAVAAAVDRGRGTGAVLPGADGADLLVLRTADDAGVTGLHAVPAAEADVTPVATLDPTRRAGTVAWEPTGVTLVAEGATAAGLSDGLESAAAVATAAELIGLADRLITMAADYARERHQFGRPIGSFQAVKHLLAGAQVRLEFARPLVYGAAWALANDTTGAARSASAAKSAASDAADEAARVALQVHGAIGYTWECDLHLYLKRAWALSADWGDAASHRAAVLASLADGGRATS